MSFILLTLLLSCCEGHDDKPLIKSFFSDLQRIQSIDILADTYFTHADQHNRLTDEQRDFLVTLINSLKERVKQEDVNELEIESLNNPSSFILDDRSLLKDMYTVKLGEQFICDIWIEDSKIKSFSTLNKGDKRYFMPIY